MEYRTLGRTGLKVSVFSFGTMTFGGTDWFESVGNTQVDEARELLALAIDAGVNLVDTADVYSLGLSEEILGKALGSRRDEVLLATKLHFRMGDGPNDLGQSRHHIVRAVEASLRRLGTDHIDLYQVHGFDGMTAVEETLSALDDLVRSGKVRYIGCSNLSGWHLMKSLAASDARGLARYCSLQAYYSLVGRELEHELVPLCLDQELGILVWSPLTSGFLGGRFRRGEARPDDTRFGQSGFPGKLDLEQGYDVLDVLERIAGERGASVAEVALKWLLGRPGVTSIIVGARNRDQLERNLRAVTWELEPDELAELSRVSAPALPYPYWHQQIYNSERLHEIEP